MIWLVSRCLISVMLLGFCIVIIMSLVMTFNFCIGFLFGTENMVAGCCNIIIRNMVISFYYKRF